MAAQPTPRLSPEQYLKMERAAPFRSEFFDGHMYAMSGGSYPHARIIGNLTGEFHAAFKRSTCAASPSEIRIRVSSSGLYTYPDVVVVSGEPKFADDQKDTLLNPVLIVEVLSPSTEAYDRGFKFAQYRTIESLEEYALVSQAEARVELYRRREEGEWLFTEAVGLEAACRFASVDCSMALADVYSKVTFESVPADAARPAPGA